MNLQRTRREFLEASGVVAMASTLSDSGSMFGQSEKKVRVGFVGVGMRGSGLLEIALAMPDVDVPAICDINRDHLEKNLAVVEKARGKRPEGYGRGDCARRALDEWTGVPESGQSEREMCPGTGQEGL